jgi:phosphate transport system substrate-binding protein
MEATMNSSKLRDALKLLVPALVLAAGASARASQTAVLHAGSSIQYDSFTREGENYRFVLPTLANDPLLVPASEVLCVGDDKCAQIQKAQAVVPGSDASPRPSVAVTHLSGKIGVSGSNTIGEILMPELIMAFAAANGHKAEKDSLALDESEFSLTPPGADEADATIDLFAHGSTNAIPDMITHKASIGMRSSPIPDNDLQEAQRAGFKDMKSIDSEHVLAVDGLAVVVNPDNPVGALSADQIAKIFSGKISNWAEVGGLPGPINVNRRNDQSGTTDTFMNLVMKPSKETIAFSAKEFENSEDLVNSVAADKSGIGYVGWAYVGSKAHALSIVSSCGVPVKPTIFGIKTAEYPLTRRLFLYTNGQPSEPLAEKLESFALSDDARKVIDRNGYVSRGLDFLSFDRQAQRVLQVALGRDPSPSDTRTFFQDVQSAQRASITFRFKPGTVDLDAQGNEDLTRLAKTLKHDNFQKARFVIAGFASEKEAPPAQLHALSEKRATEITKALANRGAKFFADNVLAKGYGSGAPVTCPEQDLNSRVEIWVVEDSGVDLATQ